jgi:hypothetical protein
MTMAVNMAYVPKPESETKVLKMTIEHQGAQLPLASKINFVQ